MNREELPAAVASFRELRDALTAATDEHYPPGCVVRVDNPRYHGLGIVARQPGCPADWLPVLLSNGNVWWYELETIVERVKNPAEWPTWIRQAVTERKKRENAARRWLNALKAEDNA